MAKNTKEIKAIKKEQVEVKKQDQISSPKNKPKWMPSKVGYYKPSKSDLPGVVETTSLGQIKKPKPSKKP
ncbi:MAG: hypothetical protein O8C63_06465 [Candidatus Methanoperedens sp.]|nr:hypothetical protein [Candidatus Methanoperedens sp.]